MSKKSLVWQIPFLVFLIVGSVFVIRGSHAAPYQQNSGTIFGTTYHITYQSADDYQQAIEAELRKVDGSLSMFNKSSVISAVNANRDVEVDDMFIDVFNLAEKVSADTDGAFDITVAPLVNLWGFGFKNGQMPTRERVDSARQLVGYKRVKLAGRHITKADPRIMLDCSAIAKGYGSDVVARFLKSRGIDNFMIEIGGEVVVSGVNSKGTDWRIGVSKPTDDSLSTSQELEAVIDISNRAMATSGNYRNFYYKGGRKYAHTIDPKTGRPVQHSLLSATVVAADCATADAYATSFMVMGREKAERLLKRHPEMQAYLIYADEKGRLKVWKSSRLKVDQME